MFKLLKKIKTNGLVQKNEEYLSYLVDMDESEILPGVLKVLEYLKDKNQFIALGSASKNARPILEKTGISCTFLMLSLMEMTFPTQNQIRKYF
jgi:beta-phosphoglucomutase-like phosphatase (HAD superfamily)